jgi:putative transposase
MPRMRRLAPGGMLFHVLNRRVARLPIFQHDEDYAAFQRVVEDTLRIAPIRICAFCWLPNHWHFVLWPRCDGDLSEFMQRMGNMHTQRWERAKRKVGYGHLYQSRFKSFPIESDDHFYTVVRYVERNSLRANLVARAEDWRWGSLRRRAAGLRDPLLAEWPLPEPADWCSQVSQPQTEAELEAIRRCMHRGCPYGGAAWTERTAEQLDLQSTCRPRGRPSRRH